MQRGLKDPVPSSTVALRKREQGCEAATCKGESGGTLPILPCNIWVAPTLSITAQLPG